MPHSFNKIWIHAIWATKKRFPLIHPEIEKELFHFMRIQFIELGCPVRIINGMPDHVHCLFLISPKLSIADVIKQVKGSTTQFVNERDLITEKFSWQTGYAAFSVSESQKEKVFEYIRIQKIHHSNRSYQQEHDEFLIANGFEIQNEESQEQSKNSYLV